MQKIEFVGKLLNCQYQSLSKKVLNNLKARAFVFKKPDLGPTQLKTLPLLEKRHFLTSIRQNCQKNSLRLTKLFRLRIQDILSHLENPQSILGSNFKVILLQRDPRATINSLKREIHEWLPGATEPKKICGNLYEDYSAVIQMSKNRALQNRIFKLKYEDMVLEPYLTASKLYQFINASTEDLKFAYAYIQSHSQLQEDLQSSEEQEAARSLAKAALGLSLIQRKIRLESQWRLGQLSRYQSFIFKGSCDLK